MSKSGFNNKKQRYLCENTDETSRINAKFYASDHWHAYNLINLAKHLTGKAHTYTVERMNKLLRYYLERLARKTYCYSKSLQMIKYQLLLFIYRDFIECIKI